MKKKILIVEDESIVALNLKMILIKSGYEVCGIADTVLDALDLIDSTSPDMLILDIYLKGKLTGIDLANILKEREIAFIYLSANIQEKTLEEAKATQPYGVLVKPFRTRELLITLDVAFYRYENSSREKNRQSTLLSTKLAGFLNEPFNFSETPLQVIQSIQPFIPFDYLSIFLKTKGSSTFEGFRCLRMGFNDYQILNLKDFLSVTRLDGSQLIQNQDSSTFNNYAEFYNDEDFETVVNGDFVKSIVAETFKLNSLLLFPLLLSTGDIVTYSFYCRRSNAFNQDHIVLLNSLIKHLCLFSSKLIFHDTRNIITVHENVNRKPTQKSARESAFEGILGNNHQMLTLMDHITIVAPLDTSVLVLGESGTGKEKIAKSIHQLSNRSNQPLIIVNCASLPANLVESELFGHEKGAFTGAVDRRVGKFEAANNGTIFLDEIGEMPIDFQVKLLRVLQESEIERIGGKNPIKIDVRIIAATNRNLEQAIENGKFRLDLYYRLYIFPLSVPPLRERKDDILILANEFLKRISAKMSRPVPALSEKVIDTLRSYSWPGNVRELEHLIERTVLLNSSPVINEIVLPRISIMESSSLMPFKLKTIEENERDHILSILDQCDGRIKGKGGAAEVLGLPATTLHSKIKRLGIKRGHS